MLVVDVSVPVWLPVHDLETVTDFDTVLVPLADVVLEKVIVSDVVFSTLSVELLLRLEPVSDPLALTDVSVTDPVPLTSERVMLLAVFVSVLSRLADDVLLDVSDLGVRVDVFVCDLESVAVALLAVLVAVLLDVFDGCECVAVAERDDVLLSVMKHVIEFVAVEVAVSLPFDLLVLELSLLVAVLVAVHV